MKSNIQDDQNNYLTMRITTLITVVLLVFSSISFAQVQKKDSVTLKKNLIKTDTTQVKTANFLDRGAGTLTQIFGENLDGKATGKKLSFLELLEKMDLPADQKAKYKTQYYLQATDLSDKQKDSLGIVMQKKALEAKKSNN